MQKLGYVHALDGVRGLAITGVIAAHYYGAQETGAMGVDLFFVLSGFLITTLLLEERDRTGRYSLRGFYLRRARRLIPALAFMLVIYAAVRGRAGLEPAVLAGVYISNFLIAFSGHLYVLLENAYLGHLWSLAAEEQFYLVWPLLLPLLLRARPRRALLLLATLVVYDMVVFAAQWPSPRVSFGPDLSPAWLVGGSCLALYRHRGGRIPAAAVIAALALIALRATQVKLPFQLGSPVLYTPLMVSAFIAFIAGAYQGGLLGRMLAVRPLVWLGRISYSLYLWHSPVVYAVGWDHVEVALVFSLLVAWLSYRYVETPFRARRPETRPPQTTAPADVPAELASSPRPVTTTTSSTR